MRAERRGLLRSLDHSPGCASARTRSSRGVLLEAGFRSAGVRGAIFWGPVSAGRCRGASLLRDSFVRRMMDRWTGRVRLAGSDAARPVAVTACTGHRTTLSKALTDPLYTGSAVAYPRSIRPGARHERPRTSAGPGSSSNPPADQCRRHRLRSISGTQGDQPTPAAAMADPVGDFRGLRVSLGASALNAFLSLIGSLLQKKSLAAQQACWSARSRRTTGLTCASDRRHRREPGSCTARALPDASPVNRRRRSALTRASRPGTAARRRPRDPIGGSGLGCTGRLSFGFNLNVVPENCPRVWRYPS